MFIGEPDMDYWTQNAREFKRIAFGITFNEQDNL